MDSIRKIENCLHVLDEPRKPFNKRKQAVEDIKLCISDNQTCQALDQSSARSLQKNSSDLTWHQIFIVCHSVLLESDNAAKEEEREGGTSTLPRQKFRESALSTVALVAKKANRDLSSPHLRLKGSLDMCSNVLSQPRWLNHANGRFIGNVYLGILSRHLMPSRSYWTQMTLEQWTALCDLCMDIYTKVGTAEKTSVVQILEICVRKGCTHTPLSLHLKTKLDFFINTFNVDDLSKHHTLQDGLLRLCLALLQALALEYRGALCRFTEKILRPVVVFRKNRQDGDKKLNLLWELLLVTMTLHDARGCSSVAHNSERWRQQVASMRELVDSELRGLAREGRGLRAGRLRIAGTALLPEPSPALLAFAIQVYKQTLDTATECAGTQTQAQHSLQQSTLDETDGPLSKRRKLQEMAGIVGLAEQLKAAKQPDEIAVRLSVLSGLVSQYPEVVTSAADQLALLQALASVQASCHSGDLMRRITRCCERVLEAERLSSLPAASREQQAALACVWDKIWDMTIRAAGLNQCSAGCYTLLQALLRSSRGPSMRHAPLVRLISSGVLQPSAGAADILAVLAATRNLLLILAEQQYAGSSSSQESSPGSSPADGVASALLQWFLPSRADLDPEEDPLLLLVVVPPLSLARALVSLTLATKAPFHLLPRPGEGEAEEKSLVDRIRDTYLEIGQLKHLTNTPADAPGSARKSEHEGSSAPLRTNAAALDTLHRLLAAELAFIRERHESESSTSRMGARVCTMRLAVQATCVVAHVISYQLRCCALLDLSHSPLAEQLQELTKLIAPTFKLALCCGEYPNRKRDTMDVLTDLLNLFSAPLHPEIALLLRNQGGPAILEVVRPLAKGTSSAAKKAAQQLGENSCDDFGATDLSTENTISFIARNEYHSSINTESSFFSEHDLPREVRQQLLATKVLAYYWFPPELAPETLARLPQKGATEALDLVYSLALDQQQPCRAELVRMVVVCHLAAKAQRLSHDQLLILTETLKSLTQHHRQEPEVVHVILGLLRLTLRHHLRNLPTGPEDPNRRTAVSILTGFCRMITGKNCFGPNLRRTYVSCLAEGIKADPSHSWLLHPKKVEEDASSPLVAEVIEFLKDPFHEVRLAAARSIAQLFTVSSSEWSVSERRTWHKLVFNRLCMTTISSFDLLQEGDKDCLVNLTHTTLLSYGAIVCCAPQWRKKALFSVIQQAHLRNMPTGPVTAVLQAIAAALGVKDMATFHASNITYLLTQWLRLYGLLEFPWQLLGATSEQAFLTSYLETLVPLLLLRQPEGEAALLLVCDKLGVSVQQAAETAFPQIMSYVLPFEVEEGASGSDARDAQTLRGKLNALLNSERQNRLLNLMIERLIVSLFSRLYEPTTWQEFVGEAVTLELPEADPPHLSLRQVEDTLDSITSNPLLVHLAKVAPNTLQGCLQQLALAVYTAPTAENRTLCALQYACLAGALGSRLGELGGMMGFVVREVATRVLALLAPPWLQETVLASVACQILAVLCRNCFQHCQELLDELLPRISGTLIAVASLTDPASGPLVSRALSLLHTLVVEYRVALSSAIARLDPFPEGPQLAEVRRVHREAMYAGKDRSSFTLSQEIDHFLKAGTRQGGTGGRVAGLIHLRQQLTTRKMELRDLYLELRGLRGFSEECTNSVMHCLVAELVSLAAHSSDSQLAAEAARCLGELGPGDLTTLTLRPDKTHDLPRDVKPQVLLCGQLVSELGRLLRDPDCLLAARASAALYGVLQTSEGLLALNTMPLEQHDVDWLVPFKHRSSASPRPSPVSVDDETFASVLGGSELWVPRGELSHSAWVCGLTGAALQCLTLPPTCLQPLLEICRLKQAFCEAVLPFLFYSAVAGERSNMARTAVTQQVNSFFKQHLETARSNTEGSAVYMNKRSLLTMLAVVEFVRLREHATNTCLLSDLELLLVARAALSCAKFFTALRYAEAWAAERRVNKDGMLRSVDELCSMSAEKGALLHEVLLQGYQRLGLDDGVYGSGVSRLLDPSERSTYLEHRAKWGQVMLLHDISGNQAGVSLALQRSGLHSLLLTTLRDQPDTPGARAQRLECCWRLGKWDQFTSPTGETVGGPVGNSVLAAVDYETHHYVALRALHTKSLPCLKEEVGLARACVTSGLSLLSLEGARGVYASLGRLQALQELEHAARWLLRPQGAQENGEGALQLQELLDKWRVQDRSIPGAQFEALEPVWSQRCAVLSIGLERGRGQHGPEVKKALAECLLHLAESARVELQFPTCERALRQLTPLISSDEGSLLALRWRVEEARALWQVGDQDMGCRALAAVLPDLERAAGARAMDRGAATLLHATALGLYGSWLAETRCENAQLILRDYLEASVEKFSSLEQQGDKQAAVEALRAVAKFADVEYTRLNKYLNSPEFKNRMRCIEQARATASTLEKERSSISDDKRRAISLNKKHANLDQDAISDTQRERDHYLEKALIHYLKALQHAGGGVAEGDVTSVFRVVSMWLENRDSLSASLQEKLERFLQEVPSFKFLPVVPQLVPHVSATNDRFTLALNTLLERLCRDHPHHSLPILLALAKLHEDAPFLPNPPQPEARVTAAHKLVSRLQRGALSEIISQMSQATEALVQLAYYKHAEGGRGASAAVAGAYPVISKLKVSKLRDLYAMQVPTVTLPVSPAAVYNNITGIQEFEPHYYLVGGITAPKRVTCVGTDGIKRTQLLKGMDDLHQDAVMQQVFTIVNSLLKKNKRTAERRLLVRTYKVIPLSQRSGLIEWCENTEPIGGYLSKAHPLYRPHDLQPKEAKAKMYNAQARSTGHKLKVYQEICQHLKPVFHHFFDENYPQPAVWFERKLAYSRSVATTSMIGYILGLGDRHVQNILVDKSTAEVIHIDFGIAFEQGLVLNVPETVPFRLTRDMEDALGVSGIEGLFRRSCEETMEVLRDSQETLLTILQVLLYDPLYMWTISPANNDNNRAGIKGERNKTPSATETNRIAERALARLQQKLQGTESQGTPTSAAGQVNRLLQLARDPENLSRLFHGWQPYL